MKKDYCFQSLNEEEEGPPSRAYLLKSIYKDRPPTIFF